MSEISKYVKRQEERFQLINTHLEGIARDVQEFKELVKELRKSTGLSAEDRVLLGGLEAKTENLANKIAEFDDSDPDGSVPEDNTDEASDDSNDDDPDLLTEEEVDAAQEADDALNDDTVVETSQEQIGDRDTEGEQ